ncbi:MAG TPA: TonB family protein [Candidatus Competibacter sp.]|nr:TonB family protein [Candidatus Competibacter sp.]
MSDGFRPRAGATRLSVAALLAVAVHAGLACLPAPWRPTGKAPTVLRVTLVPPPAIVVPVPSPPAAVALPPAEPTAPASPSSSPVAPVDPALVAKAVQPPPKPRIKPQPPEPKPTKPAVEPVPVAVKKPQAAPSRPPTEKPVKRLERPPVVAKPTGDEPGRGFERFRPARQGQEAAATPFGSLASAGGDSGSGRGKAADGDSGGSAMASAPAQPARPPPAATGLRPLPGGAPQPRYPPLARQRGIEGRVVLRLTVNAAGAVEAVGIAQSSGDDLLDQEARLTAARWRFQPLQGRNQAVAQVPITFRLRN